MAKPKGMVLVFSLLIILFLTVLLEALYLKSIAENKQANKYVNSARAFWLAEAGIATVKGSPGLSAASGSLGGAGYIYNVPSPQALPGTGSRYWILNSTGTVNLPDGSSVTRTLSATVKTAGIDASKFPYAIDTTAELEIKGSAVEINGSWREQDGSVNFNNMFGIAKTTMRSGASHIYTDTNFGSPVNQITWVDVASGQDLNISGNLTGSGILVINGNAKFSGTVIFDGIIYVIGTLTMTGNVTTSGSVVAESSAEADTTLKGNVTINYDLTQIENALAHVQFLSKQIVAWQEA